MQLKKNILQESLGCMFFFGCTLWKKLLVDYFYFILKPSYAVNINNRIVNTFVVVWI